MHCTNCGSKVALEDNVCSNCGHILKPGFSPPSGTAPSAQVPYVSPSPAQAPSKNKSSNIGLVLVAGVGLILVALFVLKLGSQPSQSTSDYSQNSGQSAVDLQQTQQQKTIEVKSENFDAWVTYVRITTEFLDEWDALVRKATDSNRIEMVGVIDEMSDLQVKILNMNYESQFHSVHQDLIELTDLAIEGFTIWREGGSGSDEILETYSYERSIWVDKLNNIEH